MAKTKFPSIAEELTLHERVLGGDRVVPVDVFQNFMDPLCAALHYDLRCREEETYDSATDAVLSYLQEPVRYDRKRGRLSTYLMDIAKKRAIDRLRSRVAGKRRESEYASSVELQARNPKEEMNTEIEARELWRRVEEVISNERDRKALRLILMGEISTEVLAEELELTNLPPAERRREVKRIRDRLLKQLRGLGDKYDNEP